MNRHIAVIDPGMRVPELDCFNRMARVSPLPLTYHLPAMFGLDSLRRAEGGLAGVVVLGSGASVNDDLPWQTELREWLAPRLTGGVPSLGLCYGHQLFASVLGGEVGFVRPDRVKLKGIRRVRLAPDPLWGSEIEGPLLVTHREGVSRLPDGCVILGASPECAVEAFRHAALPVWGFQAHPEATPAFALNNDVPLGDPADLAFGNRRVDEFLATAGAAR